MKSSLLKFSCAMVLLSYATLTAQAASVTWGAYTFNAVGDSNGNPLPVGDLVLLGNFGSLTPTQISTASFATLQSSFINYSAVARHIGDGSPISGGTTPTNADAGYWQENGDTNSTTTLGIAGKTMYYWVFNSTSMSTATQEGVFTAAFNGSSANIKSNWLFPSDTTTPNSTTVDIFNVTPYTSGTTIDRNGIVIGGYSSVAIKDNGYQLYELAPIPEPSAYAILLGAGAIALVVGLRKTRQKGRAGMV